MVGCPGSSWPSPAIQIGRPGLAAPHGHLDFGAGPDQRGEGDVDEYEQADQERRQLLATPCGFCGQAPGFRCVDAGGRELGISNQHKIRYSQARVKPGVLRALLAKARLV